MSKFGEVEWSDEPSNFEKKFANSKDLWLRLKKGSNEIRLVTKPYQYSVHKFKKEGDPGFGQKVYCSQTPDCPLCTTGNPADKAKTRWLVGVITREDNTFKILDISRAIFSEIHKYSKNLKSFGDPSKYDINIEVDPNGGPSSYYSVQALQKEPLSATDQDIKDKVDLDDMKRRVTPPTVAKVLERLEKLNGSPFVTAKVVAGSTPAVDATGSDDMDADFPAYNSEATQ